MADAPKILGSDTLRQTYPKLNAAIDNSNEAITEAIDAKGKAESAVQTAASAEVKADSVQAQFNQVVIEGDSSVEAAQARVKADGTSFTTLRERLNSSDAQLAQTTEEIKTNLTVKSRRIRPIVTFIDDDAVKEVYTRYLPIFESKGVPFCTAVISGRLTHPDHMTRTQIKEIEDKGHQVMGHSRTHPVSTGYGLLQYADDYEKLEYEIGTGCRDTLITEGFNPMGFVYPQNSSNFDVREITKRYYDYAFGGIGINISDEVLDTMNIKRIAFGAYTNGNPTIAGHSGDTLAYYKACVDYAYLNNAWLVFMTHVSAQSLESDAMLGQLIDYIKNSGIDILTAEAAYKIHGNRYFAGDVQEGNYFTIDKHDIVRSSGGDIIQPMFHSFNDGHSIKANTPLSAFADGVTVAKIPAGADNSFLKPDKDGLLTTYKYSPMSAYQEYKVENEFYFRNANANGIWASWQPLHKANVNADVKFDTPATQIPLGINIRYINSSASDYSNFPGFGILKSVKAHDLGYGSYQEFHVRLSNNIYKRYWNDTTNTWSAFTLI